MENFVQSLEGEVLIITKLLARNKNQHCQTVPYRLLRKAIQSLNLIPLKSVQSFYDILAADLKKSASHQKIDSHALNAVMITIEDCHKILVLYLEVAYWTARSAKYFVSLISRKVFVPLYSTFLASAARVFKCVVDIIKVFEVHIVSLSIYLKRISIVQGKNSLVIDNLLERTQFNSAQGNWIRIIKDEACKYSYNTNRTHSNERLIQTDIVSDRGEDVGLSLGDTIPPSSSSVYTTSSLISHEQSTTNSSDLGLLKQTVISKGIYNSQEKKPNDLVEFSEVLTSSNDGNQENSTVLLTMWDFVDAADKSAKENNSVAVVLRKETKLDEKIKHSSNKSGRKDKEKRKRMIMDMFSDIVSADGTSSKKSKQLPTPE